MVNIFCYRISTHALQLCKHFGYSFPFDRLDTCTHLAEYCMFIKSATIMCEPVRVFPSYKGKSSCHGNNFLTTQYLLQSEESLYTSILVIELIVLYILETSHIMWQV